MAFNPNIPQPTDKLSQSQADILANFQAIAPLFDGGEQEFAKFIQQTSAPGTASNELALFSQLSTTTGNLELFLQRNSNGASTELTASGSTWSRLPSGILLKWGSGSANGNTTVNFPGSPAPAFTQVYTLYASPTSGNISPTPTVSGLNYTVVVWQVTTTSFQIWGRQLTSNTSALVPFNYLAIGR